MKNITLNVNGVNYELTDLILWLLIGIIAGALASFLTGAGRGRRGRGNLVIFLLLGILGAFVGGFLLGALGLSASGFVGRLVSATIGAVLLVLLFQALSGRRRR